MSENTNPAHINSDTTLDAIIKDLKNQEHELESQLSKIKHKVSDGRSSSSGLSTLSVQNGSGALK